MQNADVQMRLLAAVVLCASVTGCGTAPPSQPQGVQPLASVVAQPPTTVAASMPSSTMATTTTAVRLETGLFVDRAIMSYLDGISLPRDAPDEFGGVVEDPNGGPVVVSVVSTVEPAVAIADLDRCIGEAIAWIDQSVVDGNGEPLTSADPPSIPVVLRVSDVTYAVLDDLSVRVTTDEWAVGTSGRVVSMGPDYTEHVLVVGIIDLTPADVAEAHSTFGDRVRLTDAEEASSLSP